MHQCFCLYVPNLLAYTFISDLRFPLFKWVWVWGMGKRWKYENELKNATNHIGIVDAAPRVSWKTIILPSYYHSHHQISQPNLIPSAPSSSQQPPSHKYLNCPPFVSTPIIPSPHTSHFAWIHFINTSHLCICIMQLSRFIFFRSYFPVLAPQDLPFFICKLPKFYQF